MNTVFSNNVVVMLVCLSAIKTTTCRGNILSSLIREASGLANSYRTAGNVLRKYEDCEHVPLKIKRPPLKDFNFKKIAQCFTEATKFGTIALQSDHGKRAVLLDQVIREHGYNMVTYHNVTSVDGYIQTIFRITGSPKSPPRKGKQAVLMIHGAMSSVDTFLMLGKRSLPFKLADEGYDVWLPANRGTDYSQGHLKYNANNDLEYWNFSFHEVSAYDIPMYFDLVLSETGEKKAFYIGYSLGAIAYPAFLSERPEYNEKIHASFLYGAGVYLNHATSPAKIITALLDMPYRFQELINWTLHGNVAGRLARLLSSFGSIFCSASAMHCSLCGSLTVVNGFVETPQLNYTQLPHMQSRILDSFSIKFWIHLAQNYKSCRYQKYDYGPEVNTELYGQSTAPLYNLLNVRAPVYIYYGLGDDMVVAQDLKKFGDALPPGTLKGYRLTPMIGTDHFSFVLSNNAPELVYDRILSDMKEYLCCDFVKF